MWNVTMAVPMAFAKSMHLFAYSIRVARSAAGRRPTVRITDSRSL
jgi:hypothetical protein